MAVANRLRFFVFVGGAMSIASLCTPMANAQPPSEVNRNQDEITGGLLFVNGDYVAPPYVIESTADKLVVNGKAVTLQTQSGFHSEGNRQNERGDNRRGGGGGGNGRSGRGDRNGYRNGGGPGGGDGPRGVGGAHGAGGGEHDDSSGPGGGGPGGPGGGRNRSPEMMATRLLDNGGVVLLFDDHPVVAYGFGAEKYDFCNYLTSRDEESLKNLLVETPGESTRETVSNWLKSYSPGPELIERSQVVLDTIDATVQTDLNLRAATARLETFAYPLTLVGMLIGVTAFGHMLKWMSTLNSAEGSGNSLVIGLWLMLAMSALDLVWTILATQAGVMTEINPLAQKIVSSPAQLALFKVVATLTGITIMYVWRQRNEMQKAAWWMCLVCVLMTFRWVIFDSMVN